MFLIHSGLIGESGRIPLLLFLYASFFCFVITRKKKKKLWLFRLLLCVLICSCIFLMVLTLLDVGCICSWSKASFLTHTVALIITGTSVPLGGMLMCRMFWCTFLLRLTLILLHLSFYSPDKHHTCAVSLYCSSLHFCSFFMLVNVTLHSGFN